MSVLSLIKTKCISLLEILRELGQKLVKPLNRRRTTKVMSDTTGKHGGDGRPLITKLCSYERIPASDIIQRRTISLPSMSLLCDQVQMDGGGTARAEASGLISATTPRAAGNQETPESGQTQPGNSSFKASNSLESNGVFVKSEEEDAIRKKGDVKRKISTALSAGIMGAKIASLFFTVYSVIFSLDDDETADEEMIEL